LIGAASDAKPMATMVSLIQPEFLDPLRELLNRLLKAGRDPTS